MARKSIRMRAKMKGSITEVKALISHVMETGLRTDQKTGKNIPAHFIREVKCEHNGKSVLIANWGIAVSKNPVLGFKFAGGAKGDTIKVSWNDNMGKSATSVAKIN